MYLCPLYTNTFIGEQGALSLDIWLIPNVCVILRGHTVCDFRGHTVCDFRGHAVCDFRGHTVCSIMVKRYALCP